MIGVSLEEAVEGNLPFIAIAFNEFPDPLLLLWREWSVPALIFIVELHAVQITGEALAHGGEVFLHHTVKEMTKASCPYHDIALVIPTALTAF